jgi:hypothetical protein
LVRNPWALVFQEQQAKHAWLFPNPLLHKILDSDDLGMIALLKPTEPFCGSPSQLKWGL